MTRPLVSVMIPCYNQVEYIAEAITTAVEQDYPHVQAVVSDDGSTDGTQDVVRELAAKYPHRITAILGDHVGLAGNCNRALEACRGAYVAFTSGDDVFLPGKLARQVAWMEEDERRVVGGHDVEVFDSGTGRVLYPWSEYFALPEGAGASRLVRVGHIFPAPSIFARAGALQRHRYDARFGMMCDWKFWIDVLAGSNGHYGVVDGVLARYRRHATSITASDSTLPMRSQSVLMTLGAVEATYPWLLRECRMYRARIFLKLGAARLSEGEGREARRYLWAALRSDPWCSWKVPAALLLASAPDAVGAAVMKRYVSPTKI
jgi:glycosyltransferase involved in cell wall biosynthesis